MYSPVHPPHSGLFLQKLTKQKIMADQPTDGISNILQTITTNTFTKQEVYQTTMEKFKTLATMVSGLAQELEEKLSTYEKKIDLRVEQPNDFEIRLQIAGDMIVFSMHSNIFNFPEDHSIHQLPYIKEDPTRAYCGVIQVYNFLADSFKYHRLTDLGFLIARMYLNKESHFFVEGHRQLGFLYNDITNAELNEIYLRAIIEASIEYSLDTDLLAPPFEATRQISVQAMEILSQQAGWQTAKAPGYKFSFMKDDNDTVGA